ncbi:serine hydrolase [Bordetella petrii]|uniref:serine hydrolase n=1 Tax=Bordetella petrii TaxID=94624 RepID=UPI001E5E1373|nr:serine hydrolase [Bordetella petrii]MCD0503369.1 serine hydrolase [Bordetella petrii]
MLFSPWVGAQPEISPPQAIERLFNTAQPDPSWFAPQFLAQVPYEQVTGLLDQLEKQHGEFQSVKKAADAYRVTLERAQVPTHIVLDPQGRITGLRFEAPIVAGGLADHVDAIAGLPGSTSVLVLQDGQPIASHDPDAVLAVGSAAKLAILKAVADAASQGRLAWDKVVPLDPAWQSLPTGVLQDWPARTPLTISTLANLMISISDNTATDALIRLVGRPAVEAITPRNTPFLTTRELFTLKAAARQDLRNAWVQADRAGKQAVLERLAGLQLPAAAELSPRPTIAVEWFLSVRELCGLIDGLAGQPALHINTGLARRANWARTAFKGGSEPGVLSLVSWVQDQAGTRYCVAATWNDQAPLDEPALMGRYRSVLEQLRHSN